MKKRKILMLLIIILGMFIFFRNISFNNISYRLNKFVSKITNTSEYKAIKQDINKNYSGIGQEKVKNKEADKGILICNSGEGVAISANKVKGIRCGIGYNNDVAHLVVEHNNCNMIAFGAHFFSVEQIMEMVDIFLSSKFEGGRHEIRVNIISDYEDKHGL